MTGVYVVGEGDELRLRQVRVGASFDGRTEVLSGLREGERIAADPVRAAIFLKSRTANRDE